MFYKTTVHSLVPGGVVDSRGKALTFIGNKVARVGDTIWTDGRVVFGHTPVRGSPILAGGSILAGGDEAIPIAMYDSDDDKIHFYIFKHRLFKIGESPVIGDSSAIYYIDGERRTNFVRDAFMINDTKRSIYWQSGFIHNHVSTFQHDIRINAVNVDKKGNIYTIQGNGYGLSVLSICKNKEFLFNIDLSDLTSTNREQVETLIGGTPGEPSADAITYTGFIENENEWAVIVKIHADAFRWISGAGDNYISGGINRFYLATPLKTELLYECIHTFSYHSGRRSCSINRVSNSDVKIPLPDGYYYTINSYPRLSVLGNSSLAPLYMEITIFAPNGGEILTDIFHVNSYITITQITTKEFLLGVKIRHHGTLGNVVNKDFECSITNELSVYLRNSFEDIKSRELFSSIHYELIGDDPGHSSSTSPWALIGHWEYVAESPYEGGDRDVYEWFEDYDPVEEAAVNYLHNTPFVGNGLYLYTPEKGLEKIAKGVCINQRMRHMPRRKIKAENFTFKDLI